MTKKYPVFDGHNDTLLRLFEKENGQTQSFFQGGEKGHIDLPRARAGGFAGGFFAVFVPNSREGKGADADDFPGTKSSAKGGGFTYEMPIPAPLDFGYATRTVMGMARLLYALEADSQGEMTIVRTAGELESAISAGVLASVLHFEGAEAIDTDLNALHVYYAAGLRSLGIVWSRHNAFGYGVPFKYPAGPDIGPGLTDAGKRLVTECNALGIMVDLSHLNEAGFWDVAARTSAPLVATHSNAHALCASPRNLTDRQLDAVAESGGVVGLNYHVGFLRADGRSDQETSLSEIVRHARYMADRIGVDHLALGSDFDGAKMPADLKDVAGLPRLTAALQDAGFSDDDLMKITHQNWIRVLKQTWR
jgi:membrane dipeptidase